MACPLARWFAMALWLSDYLCVRLSFARKSLRHNKLTVLDFVLQAKSSSGIKRKGVRM